MKKIAILSVLTLSAALTATQTQAAVIAQYNFEAGNRVSTDTETNTSASDLSNGAGVGFAITTNTVDQNGNAVSFSAPVAGNALTGRYVSDIQTPSESLAAALADSNYISFTLTTGGSTVDLSSFNFSYQISGGGATPGAYLLADAPGGTFDASDLIGGGDSVLPSGPNTTTISFDLTSVADFTADTEFRLYLATTATSDWGFAYDNLQLEGTVTPIPEPTTTALLGLGGLALILRRRK